MLLVKILFKNINVIPTFDLRIGNWLMVSNVVYHVTSIHESKITLEGLKYAVKQEDLQPIRVTKEILEKSGFKQLKQTDLYEKIPLEGFTYKLDANRVMVFHPGENTLCHWLNSQIIYLHQLQNFYYILTGRHIYWEPNYVKDFD